MATTSKEPTCRDRWKAHKDSRLGDIRGLIAKARKAEEEMNDFAREEAEEELNNYALAFDYVAPETWDDQLEGYWRYQISWGGPSDEIRFYSSGPTYRPYRVEYWFMDWGDGHGKALRGRDLETALLLWEDFQDTGTVQHVYNAATEDR